MSRIKHALGRLLGRRLVVTAALAGVLGLTVLAVPDDTTQAPDMVLVATEHAKGIDIGRDVIWVLAVGSDARPGEDMTRSRGDAIQMVGINTRTGAAAILGVPRDSWVDIPGHGMNKINSALYFGGPRVFGQTVGRLIGIQPDYVFITRFPKFESLVNGIGGVDIVNRSFFADNPLKPKGFKAGRLHLGGYDAMAYSRIRHALLRGDFDRSGHQQVVVKAIQRKVRQNRARPGFLARGVVSVMKNLHTDLSPVQLFRLGHVLADIDPAKVTNCVVQGSIGNISGQSVVLPYVATARQMGQDAKRDGVISRCRG
ncbi:LCP family protein [Nocardioides sp. CER19]|uniref:LCP family protein n=1 Tax=Nocardioides sp. CER19 TaxID=3038538 RepID=UPI00244C2BAA|nr:LCP family protein [Nocardioides sp. CER19]MDH2415352.1 LCP family protein [Nocardioides sp. CER19]